MELDAVGQAQRSPRHGQGSKQIVDVICIIFTSKTHMKTTAGLWKRGRGRGPMEAEGGCIPGLFLRPQGFVQGAMGWWARWKPVELRRGRGPRLRDSRKASQDPSSLPSHQPGIRERGWEEHGQQLGLNVSLLPVSRVGGLGQVI